MRPCSASEGALSLRLSPSRCLTLARPNCACCTAAHGHHAEVVLAKLAGHAFEADERGYGHRPQPPDELVERALAAAIAVLLLQPAHDLPARQRAVLLQPTGDRLRRRG